MPRKSFEIGGQSVGPGSRATIDLPLGKLYTHNPITMPVHVVHGRRAGPVLFVSAAVHGDELNGIEIIRRLLQRKSLRHMRGTLIAVPIVNVLGVVEKSRYLPDRRDLNRSFPGYETGTLASRLAHLLMEEIIKKSDYGIDLHTGAVYRDNLPQVRGDLDNEQVQRMADVFGTPVTLNSALLEGSLRHAASEEGIPVLVYEAGEALRFDEVCIRAGMDGVLNVMRMLEMIRPSRRKKKKKEPVVSRNSSWVRAPASGILRLQVPLGARVSKDERLGLVSSPFGEDEQAILAPFSGIVIGRTNIPLAHQGEALFHIAKVPSAKEAYERWEDFRSTHTDDTATLGDEPPIV